MVALKAVGVEGRAAAEATSLKRAYQCDGCKRFIVGCCWSMLVPSDFKA